MPTVRPRLAGGGIESPKLPLPSTINSFIEEPVAAGVHTYAAGYALARRYHTFLCPSILRQGGASDLEDQPMALNVQLFGDIDRELAIGEPARLSIPQCIHEVNGITATDRQPWSPRGARCSVVSYDQSG